MPSIIPNNIHFIWLGGELSSQYSLAAVTWAVQNPRYQIYLWTESGQMEARAQSLADAVVYEDGIRSQTTPEPDKITVHIATEQGEKVTVLVSPISIVPPLTDPTFLYEELEGWKNYGAASDFLRYWILHLYGGIYMDFDVRSPGGPIPPHITAPQDILFGRRHRCMPILVVSLVAGPARSEKLISVVKHMESKYKEEYEQPLADVYMIPTTEQQRQQELANLRTRKKDAVEKNDEDETDYVRGLIRDTIGDKTASRTGGIALQEWFSTIEAPDPDVTDINDYFFQVQSQFELVIGSDASWI